MWYREFYYKMLGKYFFYIQTSMNILWVDWRLCFILYSWACSCVPLFFRISKKEWDFRIRWIYFKFFQIIPVRILFHDFKFVYLLLPIVPTFLSFWFKPIKFVNCHVTSARSYTCMTTCHLFWLTLACLIICRWRRPSTKALFQTTYFVLGCDEGDETLSVANKTVPIIKKHSFSHSSRTLIMQS